MALLLHCVSCVLGNVLDQVIDGVVHLHYGLGSAVGATSSGMFTSCRFAFLCENMLRCEVEPCDFNVLDDESEVKHINHSFMAWSTYRDDYTVRGICMMAGGNPLHTLFVACILVKTDWTRMYKQLWSWGICFSCCIEANHEASGTLLMSNWLHIYWHQSEGIRPPFHRVDSVLLELPYDG